MSASAPAPAATGALEALFRQSHGSVTLHPANVQAKLCAVFAGQGVTASEIRLTWPSASASVEEVEEVQRSWEKVKVRQVSCVPGNPFECMYTLTKLSRVS